MINFKASTCTMQHTTKGTCVNVCTYIFKAWIMSNHWPLMLWHSSSDLRTKISITLIYNANSDYQITTSMTIFGNGKFFIYPMFRQISHPVEQGCMQHFFNSHLIEAMIFMPDETVLERMMTALDLEFKKVCTTMMRDI